MNSANFETKVLAFWRWFETISDSLLLTPTKSDLVNQVDSQVRQLGHFDWEIGPFGDGLLFFAISPNLDSEKLELTRYIINLAPQCAGWCFFPSKPAKDWQGIWKMKDFLGKEILVNSSEWEYILYEYDDHTLDMDLLIDLAGVDEDTRNTAIDIALTGYLGEEYFMRLIQNIKVVNQFESEDKGRATKLRYIKKHIERIT